MMKLSMNKIHELGITIFPEKDLNEDLEPSEDFYGSDLDDLDDDFVNHYYREGDKSTDAVLCCAMCFTPVCYQCKIVGTEFSSKSALNAYVDDYYEDPSHESVPQCESVPGCVHVMCDSMKRRLRGSTTDSEKIIKCIECNNIIAKLDSLNNFTFQNIIANKF